MSINGYNYNQIVDLYNSVGLESRNMRTLAKWFYDTHSYSYLPSIDNNLKDQLILDKLKLIIFNILIDDLADNYKIRNKDLFEKAIRIPWNGHNSYQNQYLEVTRNFWGDFHNSIKSYPRYDEFKDVFFFDLDQFLDSVKYSMLIHTTTLDESSEIEIYSPHNMQIVLFLDMDLMCSPDFDKRELGRIRSVQLNIQNALHMAHVINTFPREIEELDFSSPAISIGLRDGIIDKDMIVKNPKKARKNLEYLVPYLKNRAEENFKKIEESIDQIQSIDLHGFTEKVRMVYDSFLERPPYWEKEDKIVSESKIPIVKNDQIKWIRM